MASTSYVAGLFTTGRGLGSLHQTIKRDMNMEKFIGGMVGIWGGLLYFTRPAPKVSEIEWAARDVEYALKKKDMDVVAKANKRLAKLTKH